MKSLKPITPPATTASYKSDVPFDRRSPACTYQQDPTIDEIQSTETLIVLQNPIMLPSSPDRLF